LALVTSVAKRRSTDNSHARLRGDARGRDGGVRTKLAGMKTMPNDDQLRSMRDPAVCEHRRAMLSLPHMIQLKTFAEKLRRPGLEFLILTQ
jgi:hypothetical protein